MGMMEELPRLSPAMVSRKLQVLAFVQRYYGEHHAAPSQYEIANGLGVSRTQVWAMLRVLVAEGRLVRVPGATQRGVRPATVQEELLRQLAEMGWTVYDGERLLLPPLWPDHGLPPVADLDHVPLADLDHDPDAADGEWPDDGSDGGIG